MRYTLFCIFGLMFAGCRVYEPTDTNAIADVPESFTQSGDEKQMEKWWLSLNDTKLNELMEEAFESNFTIQAAYARLEQAREIAVKAGVDKLPEVNYSASASRSKSKTGGNAQYSSSYSAGLTASYEIDLWKRIESYQKAAIIDAEATEQDLFTAKISLSASIAKAWYSLQNYILQTELLKKQIDINNQSLEVISMQFRQGKSNASDVLSQQRLVESAKARLIEADKNVATSQNQLAILLGRNPKNYWQGLQPSMPEIKGLPQVGIPSELLARRPDVVSAMMEIEAADYRTAVAIANKYPTITISASLRGSDNKIEDVFDDWLGSLAAGIAGPLFDAGNREAEIRRTKAVLDEAIAQYRQSILTALGEVEDAITTEIHQAQYLKSIDKQLSLANDIKDSVRRQYLKGQLGYIYILNAMETQQELEISQLNSRLALINARIDLCKSIAGSWDDE